MRRSYKQNIRPLSRTVYAAYADYAHLCVMLYPKWARMLIITKNKNDAYITLGVDALTYHMNPG